MGEALIGNYAEDLLDAGIITKEFGNMKNYEKFYEFVRWGVALEYGPKLAMNFFAIVMFFVIAYLGSLAHSGYVPEDGTLLHAYLMVGIEITAAILKPILWLFGVV